MIDRHSHLLMSSSGREKRAVTDLTEVDLGELFAGLDRLGIERVVSLVQDTSRVWGGWTGTNDLAIDLQTSGSAAAPTRCCGGAAGPPWPTTRSPESSAGT